MMGSDRVPELINNSTSIKEAVRSRLGPVFVVVLVESKLRVLERINF